MDEEIERLVVSVRGDVTAFAGDVARMRAELDGPLAGGAERAGRALETSLARAVRSGRLGFDELKRAALSAFAEIAARQVSAGVGDVLGEGGLIAAGTRLLGAALGLPGRATGGPVSPGRAYLVGERGPEMFVPTTSGRVEPQGTGGARDVRVAIRIESPAGAEGQALARSGRQVARAVRRALDAAER